MLSKPSSCAACPLASISTGFSLDWGDPKRAKLAIQLMGPGRDEIAHTTRTKETKLTKEELERRLRMYPSVEARFRTVGCALVGPSWSLFSQWVVSKFNLSRDDLYITNTLRCLPPKNRLGDHYPIGKDRELAETICRQYDRLNVFAPTVAYITFHPAALLRDVTPLPLLLRTVEKAKAALANGERPLILMGQHAMKQRLKLSNAIASIQGHYERVGSNI
ncbi:MAG: hypothetical protein KGI66_00730 [Patescibacteria group bacterium]|nr:hypothetical protein [Patescibacteria group bacterium]